MRQICFILAMLIGMVNLYAQQDLFINKLIGSWQGSGKLMGADAKFSMQWKWVLGEKFVRLTFQNRISRDGGAEVGIDAEAYYQPKDEEQYEGTWFDSCGMVLPLQASVEDSALITLWGSQETEQGKTIYRLIAQDKIEVKDFVLKENEWKQFGNAVYQKK